MSQFTHGTIDATTKTGTQLAVDLASEESAQNTNHSGASRPSYAVAGMTWVKVVSATAHEHYYFDGTDDILMGIVNPTANTWTVSGAGTFSTITTTGNVSFGATSSDTITLIGYQFNAAGAAATPSISAIGDTNTGLFFPSADSVGFSTAGSEIARFDSSGNFLVGKTSATSNGGVIQTSNGVTFPSTQSPCSDANTLDDYEEGTWTPSLGGTATYTLQNGYYTKIGRLVCVSAMIQINNIGTGSTTVISGLPYTSNGGSKQGGEVAYFSGAASSFTSLKAAIDGASTTIQLQTLIAAGTSVGTANVFTSGTRLDFCICYQV